MLNQNLLANQHPLLGSQNLTSRLNVYADILVQMKDVTLLHIKLNRRVIQVQRTVTGWNIWDISHGGKIHIIDDVSDEVLVEAFIDLSTR